MKNKEKGVEKNSKKDGEILTNRKIHNFLDCGANQKHIFQYNQINHNPNIYKK